MRWMGGAAWLALVLVGIVSAGTPQESRMEEALTKSREYLRSNEFWQARPWVEKVLEIRGEGVEPPGAFLFFAAQTFARTGDTSRAHPLLEQYLEAKGAGTYAYDASALLAEVSPRRSVGVLETFLILHRSHPDFYRIQRVFESVRQRIREEDRQAQAALEAAEFRRREGMREDSLAAVRCLEGGSASCAWYMNHFSVPGDWGEEGRWLDTARKCLHAAYWKESEASANSHGFDHAIALLEKDLERFPSIETHERIGMVICRAVGYFSGRRGHACSDTTFGAADGTGWIGRQEMVLAYGERYLKWEGTHADWVKKRMAEASQIKRMEEMDHRYNLGLVYGHSWTGNETLLGVSLNVLANRTSTAPGLGWSLSAMGFQSLLTDRATADGPNPGAIHTGATRHPFAMEDLGMSVCVLPPLWVAGRVGLAGYWEEVQWVDRTGSTSWVSDRSLHFAVTYSGGGILEFTRFHLPLSMHYTLFQVHRRGLYWTVGASYAI